VNVEMEGMWKKKTVAYFKVLHKHLSAGTEEKGRKTSVTKTSVWAVSNKGHTKPYSIQLGGKFHHKFRMYLSACTYVRAGFLLY